MQAAGGDTGGGGAGHAAATYSGLRTRRGSAGMLGEINVTPLVDVVLVLLLVFMVTAPMMSRGIDVSLPVANQPQVDPETRVEVTVGPDGRVYVADKPYALPRLEDTVRGMMQGKTQKVVYLRADEALRYGKVIEVVDVLKKAGVEQIGFVYVLPGERGRR
jgi:biopolymer transport protein TolR